VSEQADGKYQEQFLPMELMNQNKDEADEAETFFMEVKLSRFDKKVEAYIRCQTSIKVRKMFELVYANFPKPKPGHEKRIKILLHEFLEPAVKHYKDNKSEGGMLLATQNGKTVLSPLQIDEIRKSVCLALLDSDQTGKKKERTNNPSSAQVSAEPYDYDNEMKIFRTVHKNDNQSQGGNTPDSSSAEFRDCDEHNEAYLLEMIRIFEKLHKNVNRSAQDVQVPDLDVQVPDQDVQVPDLDVQVPGQDVAKTFSIEPSSIFIQIDGASHNFKTPRSTTEAATAAVFALAPQPLVLAEAADAKRKTTLLAKLAETNVWGVPRTVYRLEKIKGLDELKDTPFMVELILDILSVLNELAASPSSVKQNLILLCSSEDEAELASSWLHKEKITCGAKELEEFQDKLSQGDAGLSMLQDIAKNVVLEFEKRQKGESQRGEIKRRVVVPDEGKLVTVLTSVLRQRPLSRSTVYTVFTEKYIEKKARDKHASQSTSLTLVQLQREAVEFCERLALTMTRENMPKVEYASASMLFQDSSNPWTPFFGVPGGGESRVSILELVQNCCPITKSSGVVSFLHKSVQEFYAALAIMQHVKALRLSLSSGDAEMVQVLNMVRPEVSGVTRTGLDIREEDIMAMLDACFMQPNELSRTSPKAPHHGNHIKNGLITQTSTTPTLSSSSRKVSGLNRIAHDVTKVIRGMTSSALNKLDLEQEEGVRDFLVDLLLSSAECQKALTLIAHLCSSKIGRVFAMARQNIWILLTMQNPKREGGSLLHVACREGSLPLLRTALCIMQDCYRQSFWGHIEVDVDAPMLAKDKIMADDQEEDDEEKQVEVEAHPLLMRGKTKFKTFPLVAAALHGQRDCCEEILRIVQDVTPRLFGEESEMDSWKQYFLKHALSLDFHNCQLSDSDAAMVALAMESLPSLRKLNLSNNRIGPAGCEHIGKKLVFATSLEYLDISNNTISVEGCLSLVHPWGKEKWSVGHKVMIQWAVTQDKSESEKFFEMRQVVGPHQEFKEGDRVESINYAPTVGKTGTLAWTRETERGPARKYKVVWDDPEGKKICSLLEEVQLQWPLKLVSLALGSVGRVLQVRNDGSAAIDFGGSVGQLWVYKGQLDIQSCTVEYYQGLICAEKLTELNLSKCSIGPEGSRAVASVLHRLLALTRVQLHDAIGDNVSFSTTLAAHGALVTKGCLLPIVSAMDQKNESVEVNLLRLYAHSWAVGRL